MESSRHWAISWISRKAGINRLRTVKKAIVDKLDDWEKLKSNKKNNNIV